MIKSLFEQEEEQEQKIKTEVEEKKEETKSVEEIPLFNIEKEDPPPSVIPFEISEPIGKPRPTENIEPPPSDEFKDLLTVIDEIETEPEKFSFEKKSDAFSPNTFDTEVAPGGKPQNDQIIVFSKEFEPESKMETIRRSGLAWSAGIIFFGSVVFMLVIGWIADLLLGSSPWGIVVGIVFGSIIGFIQFFRITAQIFKNRD